VKPAPSVILFSTLSGLGFGFLALLGLGLIAVQGWPAFFHWGFGYALAVGGLLASTFHLGHPERAWRAFSQWRSSWLSREGVAAVATLLILAPQALSDWLGFGWGQGFGLLGVLGCGATVLCTAMIYAQLKTVPRWHHWSVPATYLGFSLTGGLILAGAGLWASVAALGLGLLLAYGWRVGDGAFARAGVDLASATGLSGLGRPQVFEQPHTGGNYLMREMIYVVGRRHATKLRVIALIFAAGIPALSAALLPVLPALILGGASHVLGAMAQRWLFFAEAEHVVGLYYGKATSSL
jgi:sulfite dehydrogenase (quinone) subunit SoeC